MDFTKEINGHTLEYFDDDHTYLVDGVIVPSITTLLKSKFGKKYEGISKDVLERAAKVGTYIHEQIENYCTGKEYEETPEVKNFKELEETYKFKPVANEIPVILFSGAKPIAAGRIDLVINMDGKIGGADIKRTYKLDRDYLTYQLNLYREAYKQTYGQEWEFMKGIHLREQVKQYIDIPIKEELVKEIIGGKK